MKKLLIFPARRRRYDVILDLFAAAKPAGVSLLGRRRLLAAILNDRQLPDRLRHILFEAPSAGGDAALLRRLKMDPLALQILPLSEGARKIIGNCDSRYRALKTVFNDRTFRAATRDWVRDPRQGVQLDRLRKLLRDCEPQLSETLGLLRGSKTSNASIKGLLDRGCSAEEGKALFTYLSSQDDTAAILRFYRAYLDSSAGQAAADPPPWRLRLLAASARAFSQMSAFDSARSILGELRDDTRYDAEFSEEEKQKIDYLYATVAARSGHLELAQAVLKSRLQFEANKAETCFRLGMLSMLKSDGIGKLWFSQAGRGLELPPGALLLMAESELNRDRLDCAHDLFHDAACLPQSQKEFLLGLANLAGARDDRSGRARCIREYFDSFGLSSAAVQGLSFAQRAEVPAGLPQPRRQVLVSVIMTSYNSQDTIGLAVASVMAQSIKDIELIVVDDASSDDTVAILRALATRDARITVIGNEQNCGTYVSRNFGIRRAAGTYVTFHDSDDWMHPDRLKAHVACMRENPGMALSTSHMLRMNGDGRFSIQPGGVYLHHNPSSLFLQRHMFAKIGYFDSVRAAADAEFLYRVRHAVSQSAIARLDAPLTIVHDRSNSLTRSGATGFDENRYSQPRLRYTEAWVQWHIDGLVRDENLYVAFPQAARLFSAPAELLP